MSARIVPFALALLAAAVQAGAQGFAGLGTDAEGFAIPQRGTVLEFPADHGPHPDYRIEWWYLTANLRGPDGTEYGIQWTLFRSALAPGEAEGWASPQVWMGHAAVTTPSGHHVAQRLARGGTGQAGVETEPFSAWIDDWRMQDREDAQDALVALRLRAAGADFAYALELDATGPLVLQGEAGYSMKSPAGQASHYYSQPFYSVEGSLTLPEGEIAVSGLGWLDREWSSQPLAPDQSGWDWFSLHMDGGDRLMGFRLRDGGAGFTSATWIAPDGEPAPMPPGAFVVTPLRSARVAGRDVPVSWRLELPARGFDVTVTALNEQAWMDTLFAYWEGPVRFEGTHRGRGYLEMTGYE